MPFYGPSSGGSSVLVQRVLATDTTGASTTSQIPLDDTIPQNTEGAEFMTLAITPTSATNRLRIEFNANASAGGSAQGPVVALFQDTTADALQVRSTRPADSNHPSPIHLLHDMVAGTTSATTFKIRFGRNSTSASAFIGQAKDSATYGAADPSILTIEEYVP